MKSVKFTNQLGDNLLPLFTKNINIVVTVNWLERTLLWFTRVNFYLSGKVYSFCLRPSCHTTKTNSNSVRFKAKHYSANPLLTSRQQTFFFDGLLPPTPQPPNSSFFLNDRKGCRLLFYLKWVVDFNTREIIHTECYMHIKRNFMG